MEQAAGLPPACEDDAPFVHHSSQTTLVNGIQKPEETAKSDLRTRDDGVRTGLDLAGHPLDCAEDASLLFQITEEGPSAWVKRARELLER